MDILVCAPGLGVAAPLQFLRAPNIEEHLAAALQQATDYLVGRPCRRIALVACADRVVVRDHRDDLAF